MIFIGVLPQLRRLSRSPWWLGPATDSDLGVVESVRQNTRAIASLFGLEDTAGELMTGFDSRVAALASFSEG